MVSTTGSGTVNWTDAQKAELLRTGTVEDYTGHHINNVASAPDWKGDPRNIRFLKNGKVGMPNDKLHALTGHRGDYHNDTKGILIDRQAMIDAFKAGCG